MAKFSYVFFDNFYNDWAENLGFACFFQTFLNPQFSAFKLGFFEKWFFHFMHKNAVFWPKNVQKCPVCPIFFSKELFYQRLGWKIIRKKSWIYYIELIKIGFFVEDFFSLKGVRNLRRKNFFAKKWDFFCFF